jgi:molybdenum cofactor biosynthesis enzyme MoaA
MRRTAAIWSVVTVRRQSQCHWCMSTHTPTREGAVLLTPADAARLAQVSRDTAGTVKRYALDDIADLSFLLG